MSGHDRTPDRNSSRASLKGIFEKLSALAALVPCAGLLLGIPRIGYADAVAASTISFSNLKITPSAGTVQYQGAWTSQAFAQAQNSLGDLDSEFASSTGGPSTISAGVTFASASGTADVAPLSGTASSSASILDATAQAISAGTATLFNSFEITGGTGSVNVMFSADVAGMLSVMTDQFGVLAQAETTFEMQLDGEPTLFFDLPLSVGPSSSDSAAFSQTLSTNMSLDFNTWYLVNAGGDGEVPTAYNMTPEPPTASLLFIALLGVVACGAKKRAQTGQL